MHSNRKYEIYTGLFILVFFGGGLFIGEMGLRIMQYAKYGVSQTAEKSGIFYTDKETGLRLITPNKQLGKIKINNLGFRGPDIKQQKQQNSFRVAFLGSSTTYDAGSAEEKNWPHKTIINLKKKIQNCPIDFINAAQPGHSTIDMLKHYTHFVSKNSPDLVIVLPGDVNHDLAILAKEQGLKEVSTKDDWLSEHSILFSKIQKNYQIIQLQRNAFSRANKVDISEWKTGDSFKKRLIKLVRKIRDDGRLIALATISSQLREEQNKTRQLEAANTALFYMPYVALQDLISVRMSYNKIIREVALSENVILINGENEIPGDRKHYSDTMHFTEKGSEKMALRVIKKLMDNDKLFKVLTAKNCHLIS